MKFTTHKLMLWLMLEEMEMPITLTIMHCVSVSVYHNIPQRCMNIMSQ